MKKVIVTLLLSMPAVCFADSLYEKSEIGTRSRWYYDDDPPKVYNIPLVGVFAPQAPPTPAPAPEPVTPPSPRFKEVNDLDTLVKQGHLSDVFRYQGKLCRIASVSFDGPNAKPIVREISEAEAYSINSSPPVSAQRDPIPLHQNSNFPVTSEISKTIATDEAERDKITFDFQTALKSAFNTWSVGATSHFAQVSYGRSASPEELSKWASAWAFEGLRRFPDSTYYALTVFALGCSAEAHAYRDGSVKVTITHL